MEGFRGDNRKKERDANSPLLMTLKPFYCPNENGEQKRGTKEIKVEESKKTLCQGRLFHFLRVQG